jgi:hypothetical protein
MPNSKTRMGSEMLPGVGEERMPYVASVASAMEPEFTTPLAVYLVSEACGSTHSIYSSLGGRMARVFVGVTAGWQGSRTEPASVEDIAANFELIRDPDRGFDVPDSLSDEYRIVSRALEGSA